MYVLLQMPPPIAFLTENILQINTSEYMTHGILKSLPAIKSTLSLVLLVSTIYHIGNRRVNAQINH